MNKKTKQLILIIASVVLLGNIMYFSDSRLSTPEKITFQNDHYLCIQNEVAEIPHKQHKEMDVNFIQIQDEIERCLKESYITSNERDELLEQLVDKYCIWFIQRSENLFKKSVWDAKDHRWIVAKINLLRSLRIQDGTKKLIEGNYDHKFSDIIDVINRYKKAIKLTGNKPFTSIAEAKEDLEEVSIFLKDPVLKNCSSLIHDLKEVKPNLNIKHVQYLENYVNHLNNYGRYNLRSYNLLYRDICKEINDYNTYALSLYGKNISTNYLATIAKEKFDRGSACLSTYCEREIKYPKYQITDNNRSCLISAVVLYESFTKVEICFSAKPGDEIMISRATYLEIAGDNRRYFLTDAINIPYAPTRKTFFHSDLNYKITLYFQPIPLQTKYIDFIEEDINGRGWTFKDIRIIK